MLLGEIGVGKTSIARRLVFDQFDGSYKATIGTDIYRYEVCRRRSDGPFHFWSSGTPTATSATHLSPGLRAAGGRRDDRRRRHAATDAGGRGQAGDGFHGRFPGRALTFVVNKIDLLEPGVERRCCRRR